MHCDDITLWNGTSWRTNRSYSVEHQTLNEQIVIVTLLLTKAEEIQKQIKARIIC